MSVPNEFDQTPIASSESPPLSIDGRPINETPRRDFSGYLDSQVPHQSPGLPHRRPSTQTLTHRIEVSRENRNVVITTLTPTTSHEFPGHFDAHSRPVDPLSQDDGMGVEQPFRDRRAHVHRYLVFVI